MATSPDSESDEPDHSTIPAVTALPGVVALEPTRAVEPAHYDDNPYRLQGVSTHEQQPAQQRVAFTSATPGSVAHARETLPLREGVDTPEHYQPNAEESFNQTSAPQNNQTFVPPVQHAAPAHQLQPDVLSQQSLAPVAKPIRQNTNYGSWMAPAAAGVGAGALSSEAYHHQQDKDLPSADTLAEEQQTPYEDERPRDLTAGNNPTMPTSNEAATNNPAAFTSNNGISGATHTTTAPFPVLIPHSSNVPQSPEFVPYSSSTYGAETPRAESSDALGGLEREGAHETGAFFPKVVRHDTDMSVSQLHVPGEFPPATPGFPLNEENTERSWSPRPTIGSHGTFVAPSAWEQARE
jgi:hypothetical protein